ncbi:hypothetical protein GW17_00043382 [Ensete ventricosum]|nr:hypothetical protein GW17_00043382 [Ensete ventricosum]
MIDYTVELCVCWPHLCVGNTLLMMMARVRYLARSRLGTEVELGKMGGALGSGSGGWLLADFYSNDFGAFVPEALILLIACCTAAPHHVVRGPCGEARAVLPATGGMSTLPTLPLSGRPYDDWPFHACVRPAPIRRVGHVSGPAVRGREDVTVRSTSIISFPSPPRRPSRDS